MQNQIILYAVTYVGLRRPIISSDNEVTSSYDISDQ